ncbi:MAG: peptide chain release factor N(5)-glutamine methyltransferase [Steroidobacteraceae bacterium]
MQTLEQALRAAALQLAAFDSARLDAELLLAHLLGMRRGALLAHLTDTLQPSLAERYAQLLRARATGQPVAYLIGEREFWSLPLQVSPAVLVPRPDTETLVERALLRGPLAAARCADLGTGSGAIALALAHERPAWQILATDASAAALAVARANAQRLEFGNVAFAQGSWCAALGTGRFDLIVSNPPYLAEEDAALADPVLQQEPRSALVSGATGLEAYEALARQTPAHLHPGGWLLLEHGATQAAAVAELLVAQGFSHVGSHPDLAGLPRVTEAQWPGPVPDIK